MSKTKASETPDVVEGAEEPESLQDVNDLILQARRLFAAATDVAATMAKHLPIRPWKDSTQRRTADDFLITEEQQVLVMPVPEWTALFDVIPMMEEMASRVSIAEDKAHAEWLRGRELEKRAQAAEEKINNWRSQAEDFDGTLFATRARAAEKRIASVEDALRFYADEKNWNPEPTLIKAGTSVKDKGGIAREAMKTLSS